MSAKIHFQSQDIKLSDFLIMDNEDPEFCWAKTVHTLSYNSIPLNCFSEQVQNKLSKSYTSIPTTLLGRLAIDKKFQGKGIGKILLIDALKRSYEISKTIGSFGIVVDPIDNDAKSFYQRYDFIELPDSKKMFIATRTLKDLFE